MKINTLGAGPGLTKTSGLSKSVAGERQSAVHRDARAETAQWLAVGYAGKQMTDISLRMQQLDNVTESNRRKTEFKTGVNDLENEIASSNDFIMDPKAIAGFYTKRMDKLREQALDGANKPVSDHVGYAFDMHRTEADPRIDNQIRQGLIKKGRNSLFGNLDASGKLLLNTATDKTLDDTLGRVNRYVSDVHQQISDGVMTKLIPVDDADPLYRKIISKDTKALYMQAIPNYPEEMNKLVNGEGSEEFLKHLSSQDRTAVKNAARTASKNFQTDREGLDGADALLKKYDNDAANALNHALFDPDLKSKMTEDGYKSMVGVLSTGRTEQSKQRTEWITSETARFYDGQNESKFTRTEQLANAVSFQRDPNNVVPMGIIVNRISVITQNKQRSPDGVDAAWNRYLATPEDKRDLMKFKHEWSKMHMSDAGELLKRVEANTTLEGGSTNYQQQEINNLDMKRMDSKEKLKFIKNLGKAIKVAGLNSADPNVSKLASELHKGRRESDLAKMFDKAGPFGEAAKKIYVALGATDRTLTSAAPLYKTLDRLYGQGNDDIAEQLIRKAFDKDIPDATPWKREYVDKMIATEHKGEDLSEEDINALQIKHYTDIHNAELLGEDTNMPDITTELPDGRLVDYAGAEHTYHLGDQELTSTTALLSGNGAFPEFPKQLKAEERAKRENLTVEEVLRQWEQTGFDARQWGNKFHEKSMAITGMLSADKAPNPGNEKERKAFLGLEQHFEKVLGDSPDGGWKVIGQEQILADPEAHAAGTADLILEKDGVVKIVDLKTSKSLVSEYDKVIHGRSVMANLKNTKKNQYRGQLAMYKSYYLSQNPGAKVVTELWRTNKDGTIEVHDMSSKNMDTRVRGLLNTRREAAGNRPLAAPKLTKRSFMPKVNIPPAAFNKVDKLGPAARANK